MSLIETLGLDGFVHVSGPAGSGKTLLATLLAADFSKYGFVEWINADGKLAFVNNLKNHVKQLGGNERMINVTFAKGHFSARDAISQLTNTSSSFPLLCIIDPITRTLDLARTDPILWEQEFLENVLPAVAAFALNSNSIVIGTSECRTLSGSYSLPILQKALSKWADHELHVQRGVQRFVSEIYHANPLMKELSCIWLLRMRPNGTLELSKAETKFILGRKHSCLENR